ncbi:MAG TPA: GatB/YqeY domain-containing protein [Zoogloea sp.]|uniref:GatB/YqeY domain-containing protein n=1 Tax=Zoogloea sp. TaxID=49181 RepID=UPI002C32C42D|nr:GatB/YqeY domain-containing protein [Zoogloea sp.]HMV64783.1 GatB/YqeY domain-containing protein [Rhodocyclaceae bacterium]HMW51665.1 GatB/YqeY domain-containing protein [Rhodocyclaceae bacterium]HMY50226.1 GatB/YqeY domain-containing protein [Rhodocyclaceae bacterium]HMZ77138.1 GatB/YqeY domain-containing protein [Rhodocyclaceae bacterium]HNB63641.1 GatB/YqeY domain-containing protein [Rhodocyclaceae bacterium]
MSLKDRINEDMKNAMRAKDAPRLSALRLLLAAIKQRQVDERIELDDDGVIAVVDKMLKQRRDSVAQYEAAQRFDLASAERFEIDVLTAYKPAGLGADEIAAAIEAAVAATGAAGPADMGKLMAVLKPQLAGKADMAEVSKLVKTRLAN